MRNLQRTPALGVRCLMKILATLAILSMSHIAVSCPDIVGTWQSSKEMSMEYNDQFAHLEPGQKELLTQILGALKITYTENKAHEHGAPSIKVIVGGKESDFAIEDLSYPYKVLSCGKVTLTAELKHPYYERKVETLTFVDSNTYWVSSEILPATREYFVRMSR